MVVLGVGLIVGLPIFYAGVAWWLNRSLKSSLGYLTREELEGLRRRMERGQ